MYLLVRLVVRLLRLVVVRLLVALVRLRRDGRHGRERVHAPCVRGIRVETARRVRRTVHVPPSASGSFSSSSTITPRAVKYLRHAAKVCSDGRHAAAPVRVGVREARRRLDIAPLHGRRAAEARVRLVPVLRQRVIAVPVAALVLSPPRRVRDHVVFLLPAALAPLCECQQQRHEGCAHGEAEDEDGHWALARCRL